jgi:hypothetical protein
VAKFGLLTSGSDSEPDDFGMVPADATAGDDDVPKVTRRRSGPELTRSGGTQLNSSSDSEAGGGRRSSGGDKLSDSEADSGRRIGGRGRSSEDELSSGGGTSIWKSSRFEPDDTFGAALSGSTAGRGGWGRRGGGLITNLTCGHESSASSSSGATASGARGFEEARGLDDCRARGVSAARMRSWDEVIAWLNSARRSFDSWRPETIHSTRRREESAAEAELSFRRACMRADVNTENAQLFHMSGGGWQGRRPSMWTERSVSVP